MVRKRARKSRSKQAFKSPVISKPRLKISKPKIKATTVIVLVSIFFLVLFMNSYFNYTSNVAYNPEGTTIGTKFFLSGPDPYHNMRTCEVMLETGSYPFMAPHSEDPLLNYPVGVAGTRPPLFNTIAVASTLVVENFMPRMDALGWSMLFLPAIYGALIVFPVYGIGKELFNKKVGFLAAFFMAIIPAHLGAGHGSAFSLFDHDSFLLLLFVLVFFFVIKALKEKDMMKSIGYAIFAGVFCAAIQWTWIAAQYIFVLLLSFIIIQFIIDIFRGTNDITNGIKIAVTLGTGWLLCLPLALYRGFLIDYPFLMFISSLIIISLYYIVRRFKIPWLVSMPSLAGLGVIGLGILYMVNRGLIPILSTLSSLSNIIFGAGIYGNKVALTIAEAHTYALSQTVMAFGPALYWIGLLGFVLFLYHTHAKKYKPENVFLIVIFTVQFWLTTTAGRFLNDVVPVMAILAAFLLCSMIDKISYKKMFSDIKNIGGLHGLRKGIKLPHIIGISIVLLLVLLPNSFLALDAATPPSMDKEFFGSQGYFGLGAGQQIYWADACYWLSQQDTEIANDTDRPGILTWWDYGFYLASMSGHPTVADNYQSGIPPAANFHTAQSEKEATAVMIIRLVEGTKVPKNVAKGIMPQEVKDVLITHLNKATVYHTQNNTAQQLINILEDPETYAPTYDTFVASEWGNNILKVTEFNAMYHDACNMLVNLTDDEITMLYKDMQIITKTSIRYYGIEVRDMTSIFAVFPFLADKSTHGYVTMEDDFFATKYVSKVDGNIYEIEQLENMSTQQRDALDLTTTTVKKGGYYNSMAFKTFYGINESKRIPTYMMKHWYLSYVSPYISIAKYYEGAKVNGTVIMNNSLVTGGVVYVLDENKIPHDYAVTQAGQFDVIVPAGNSTLSLYFNQTLVKEILIDNITEAQARRDVDFGKTVEFIIEETIE